MDTPTPVLMEVVIPMWTKDNNNNNKAASPGLIKKTAESRVSF